MNNIRESLDAVRDKILAACQKAGRPSDAVRLVAVTKRVDVEGIRAAIALGVSDFGENYIQEARRKIEAIEPGTTWHMIGHAQANKVKYIPRLFSYVQSVDRWELLEDLDRHGKDLSILFEVNLSGEPQKHGATADGLRSMLERVGRLGHITPRGLMTMPPFSEDPEEARPIFRRLRELLQEMNREFAMTMTELSMGMSGDFPVAIEEGATMVRIGTAIFGERA
ncbi:MAG: YggS family pyridoxal phosphate-dependent enzyme [Syntrophorhabdales bacterium]